MSRIGSKGLNAKVTTHNKDYSGTLKYFDIFPQKDGTYFMEFHKGGPGLYILKHPKNKDELLEIILEWENKGFINNTPEILNENNYIKVENYIIDTKYIHSIQEDTKIRSIFFDEKNPYEWAYQCYENKIIPKDWFVHGRRKKEHLDTNYCIQLTQDWNVANSYSGKDGTVWLIKPKKKSQVLDFTNRKEANDFYYWLIYNLYKYDSIRQDIEMHVDIDFDSFILQDKEVVKDREKFENRLKRILDIEYNPKDIVNSAGAYDSQNWQEPLYDYKEGIDFVITYDGAVILGDDRETILAVRVPRDKEELEEIKNKFGDRLIYENVNF